MARRKRSIDLDAALESLTRKFLSDAKALVDQATAQRLSQAEGELLALQQTIGKLVGLGAALPSGGKRRRVGATQARELVYQALQKAGAPVGMSALRAATGYGQSTIRKALETLKGESLVGQTGERRGTVYFTAETQSAEPRAPRGKAKATSRRKKA